MKLSIITVCWNDREGLERTLRSTFESQPSFTDWEQIVVDGGSTDGSREGILRWKDHPRMGWWVSEPDTGIYNAMNKGLAHANGDWVLFLNAGDFLMPDVLARAFAELSDADVAYGDMFFARSPSNSRLVRYPDGSEVTPTFFLFRSLPHQATFISRELLRKAGGYSEDYRIVSDSKFFLDCALSGTVRFKHFAFPVSVFATGGVSTDPDKLESGLEERVRWLSGVFGEYAARKATFPSPPWWAGESVCREAIRDHGFARLLWASCRWSRFWWRIPPVRFLLRGFLAVGARVTRQFRP